MTDREHVAGGPDDEQNAAQIPPPPEAEGVSESLPPDVEAAAEAIDRSLVTLGFVTFDSSVGDNTTSELLVSEERRRHFNRDVYVGIRDQEQEREFLGRVVEGPFHAPHEVAMDSAITRTTVLHPERTRFRPSYYVSGSVEILGEIQEGERVVPTATRPRPYSEVYVYPSERLEVMLGIQGDLLLGTLMGYTGVEVRAPSDSKNFLPRNIGVFGTVGSGKSNTVQVLMEEAVGQGWAVVVIDVEGEYVRMGEASDDAHMIRFLASRFGLDPWGLGDVHVYVPSSGTSEGPEATAFKVPISAIDTGVLAGILELSEAQERMLTIIADKLRRDAERGARGRSTRQGPFGLSAAAAGQEERPYTLQDLVDGLTEDANGALPLWPRLGSGERATAAALRSKLISLGISGMLDWNGTRNVAELPTRDLLYPGRLSVLDVAETDDRSRNIAISYMLQTLFDAVISTPRGGDMGDGLSRPPVLVVIEEVHTFVSRSTASRMRAVIDQLQIISRRGRKRWMSLALVSQQPGHVPDELFELANTRFVHQLKSASNLAPVKQTTGGVHEALWSTVPALGPGQCLVSSAVFRNPLFIEVRPAGSKRLLVS